MGLFRKIGSFLGFVKDESAEAGLNKDEDENDTVSSSNSAPPFAAATQHLPRKGFSVSVQVPVDRPPPGPLLLPCSDGDGGVQFHMMSEQPTVCWLLEAPVPMGFRWYVKRLRIDEDGDIADEFLEEVLPKKPVNDEQEKQQALTRFEVKCNTRPLKIRNQVRSVDGKIQVRLESQGRLEWV